MRPEISLNGASGRSVGPVNIAGGGRLLTIGVDNGAAASVIPACQNYPLEPYRLSRVQGGTEARVGKGPRNSQAHGIRLERLPSICCRSRECAVVSCRHGESRGCCLASDKVAIEFMPRNNRTSCRCRRSGLEYDAGLEAGGGGRTPCDRAAAGASSPYA